ncbi:hypothetical protein [Chryseolinea soli]|uniref:Uncharacterized protein n=1 Tax=Chryseolinea soli TaxID=2321403 RepID=A0A385SIM4_9BACT|nr:hypothetical protein [Chryseolinea soli]AYB31593.1 hypothetical protein D4L85_13895 [Chryseolinea soli]
MKAHRSTGKAVGLLCAFFVLVLFVALAFYRYYPVLVIAGESSVGAWMSGVLLVVSATVALIIGVRRDGFVWFLIAAFFFVLALDERFMFHERMKEYIIFHFTHNFVRSRFVNELPVITAAGVGVFVSFMLWRHLHGKNRILLLCAAVLGTASVAFDVLAAGVLWEECFKLLAELIVACALLREVEA